MTKPPVPPLKKKDYIITDEKLDETKIALIECKAISVNYQLIDG